MLARRAGIEVLQVPYKGANTALTDLMGGQVALYFGNTVSVMSQLATGKIRALAVTSAQRVSSLPDVPTVAEQGYPGFEASTWLGLVGPANLPAPIAERIADATMKLLATKEVKDKLAQEGSMPTPANGAQFGEWIRSEHAKWGKLIREGKFQLN
jgi:tripartite-type tricarboxylate transporter receptor subunit TctC